MKAPGETSVDELLKRDDLPDDVREVLQEAVDLGRVTPTSFVHPNELRMADENPRSITDERMEALKYALICAPDMLLARPGIVDTRRGDVVGGNQRLRAIQEVIALYGEDPDAEIGGQRVANLVEKLQEWGGMPVHLREFRDDAERREWMLRDNAAYGDYVTDALAQLVAQHAEDGGDMALLGFTEPETDGLLALLSDHGSGGDMGPDNDPNPSLADRFLVPPFTVLDARRGEWRDRKRHWLGMGIKSEETREQLAHYQSARSSEHVQDPRFYESKRQVERELGRELTSQEFIDDYWVDSRGQQGGLAAAAASVFDPVLCELVYRWFSAPGHDVLDPFAGGSVRGIVAAALGRNYMGIDLREEQVAANRAQATQLLTSDQPDPTWIHGDARDLATLPGAPSVFDLLFSCPPYFDLEVYSDDDRDLSRAESYEHFNDAHGQVIREAVACLADDRFACWVVGDVRDKKGRQLPLVADTINHFEEAGAAYYNEAVLVAPVGSLRIRAARAFVATRKLGRTHQQLLVFCKGDPKRAADACGDVDMTAVEEAVDAAADQEPTADA